MKCCKWALWNWSKTFRSDLVQVGHSVDGTAADQLCLGFTWPSKPVLTRTWAARWTSNRVTRARVGPCRSPREQRAPGWHGPAAWTLQTPARPPGREVLTVVVGKKASEQGPEPSARWSCASFFFCFIPHFSNRLSNSPTCLFSFFCQRIGTKGGWFLYFIILYYVSCAWTERR